jgi:hypothetical protein
MPPSVLKTSVARTLYYFSGQVKRTTSSNSACCSSRTNWHVPELIMTPVKKQAEVATAKKKASRIFLVLVVM